MSDHRRTAAIVGIQDGGTEIFLVGIRGKME